MGGSNEEHMLLCFNRAAHCARKGILYFYSDLSQWKPEPWLSQLSLQYPSAPFSPCPFPFPPLFFFYFNSSRIHFAHCTYVRSFVLQIEGQCSRGTLKRWESREQRAEQTWERRNNISSSMTMFAVKGGRGANAVLPAAFIYTRRCVHVSVCHRLRVCALVSACISMCLCGSEFRHQ